MVDRSKSTGVSTFKLEGDKLSGTCGGPDKFPISGRIQNNKVDRVALSVGWTGPSR